MRGLYGAPLTSPNVAVLSLICCLPVAAASQSGRQEKTIGLPAAVSVEYGIISRAGTLVAAIGSDNVVRVWSTSTGELLQSLAEGGHPPTGVEFSTDGRLLAVAYEIVATSLRGKPSMSSPRRQTCTRWQFLRIIGASPFPLLLRLRSGTWRIRGL
jgi:WD40 repeat protein